MLDKAQQQLQGLYVVCLPSVWRCIQISPTFFSKVLSILRSDFSSINWTCSHSVKYTGLHGGLASRPK